MLHSALVWAHAHIVTDPDNAAGWRTEAMRRPGTAAALFGEQAVPLAGAGTPLVAEFAPAELAAALDLSHEAALALLGDVLDLAHRLPRLWALVGELRVPVHLARRAAQESRDLTPAAADHADRLLVWRPRRLNPHRVGVLVHEARLYADPDRAVADHDRAMETRKVETRYGQGAPGTGEAWMVLDEADLLAFDGTVSTIAATMGALGHPGSLDVRRANAVGILADPQRALDLLAVDPTDPERPDPETDPAVCRAEDAMYAGHNPFVRPTASGHDAERSGSGAGEAVLVLHLTDRDLLDGAPVPGHGGVARSATLGPMLMGRLASWLFSAATITIKPVLDIDAMGAVDTHDPPTRMVEAVRFRDEDDGGPPGQTTPTNLAPLCRRHHRAKTHADFHYHRLRDGSYRWTLPTGLQVTTDPPTPRPRP